MRVILYSSTRVPGILYSKSILYDLLTCTTSFYVSIHVVQCLYCTCTVSLDHVADKVGRGRLMKICHRGLTRFKRQTYFLMSRPNLGLTRLDYSIQ